MKLATDTTQWHLSVSAVCASEHVPRRGSKQRRGTKTCTIIDVITHINVTKDEYSHSKRCITLTDKRLLNAYALHFISYCVICVLHYDNGNVRT